MMLRERRTHQVRCSQCQAWVYQGGVHEHYQHEHGVTSEDACKDCVECRLLKRHGDEPCDAGRSIIGRD